MEKVKKIFEKYTEMGVTELLFRGRRAIELLIRHFSPLVGKDGDTLSILMAFAAASVDSDGIFSQKEIDYASSLLGLDKDHTVSLLKRASTPEKKSAAEHLFDACEPEVKLLLLDFCMCFIASDDTVDPKESNFIKSLVL